MLKSSLLALYVPHPSDSRIISFYGFCTEGNPTENHSPLNEKFNSAVSPSLNTKVASPFGRTTSGLEPAVTASDSMVGPVPTAFSAATRKRWGPADPDVSKKLVVHSAPRFHEPSTYPSCSLFLHIWRQSSISFSSRRISLCSSPKSHCCRHLLALSTKACTCCLRLPR